MKLFSAQCHWLHRSFTGRCRNIWAAVWRCGGGGSERASAGGDRAGSEPVQRPVHGRPGQGHFSPLATQHYTGHRQEEKRWDIYLQLSLLVLTSYAICNVCALTTIGNKVDQTALLWYCESLSYKIIRVSVPWFCSLLPKESRDLLRVWISSQRRGW